ncbi:cytochrome P450 [Streptomyces marianii]|uniref:Cytochrome P450 n=1 Tax=Streptomyces marianii TaxID=1817406 RepID=A0A5R9E7F2_9ACTN|nr:cytochrome P450 [Streptomyces marianii]TLQ44819.1 cytochrome P450 [Streptomyces marianii]
MTIEHEERKAATAGCPYAHHVGRLGPLPEFLEHGDEPVTRVATPTGHTMWLVRDYTLGRSVLTDRRFSRAEAVKPHAPTVIDAQPVPDSMMSMDGAEHARLRRMVTGSFTTGKVAAMAPFVERLADEHLDRLAEAGPGADLVETIAAPLPLVVLCSLLGVPPEDADRFRNWVEVLFDISVSSPREKARRRLELVEYMSNLIEEKRQRDEDDLLTSLIGAHDGGDLSMPELLTLGLTLLMAGYETTVGQLSLSALALLSDPTTLAALRERPELVPSAVEELMRLSPATPLAFPRVAVETVELGDVTVRAGEGVLVSLLHGNRDGAVFADPELLDADSRTAAHLTFGHGVHRCLGAPLARLQVRIVVERLLRRFPGIRTASGPDAVLWKDGLATRGLARLRVEW